jgi:hypothetical protein
MSLLLSPKKKGKKGKKAWCGHGASFILLSIGDKMWLPSAMSSWFSKWHAGFSLHA